MLLIGLATVLAAGETDTAPAEDKEETAPESTEAAAEKDEEEAAAEEGAVEEEDGEPEEEAKEAEGAGNKGDTFPGTRTTLAFCSMRWSKLVRNSSSSLKSSRTRQSEDSSLPRELSSER